MSTRSGFARVAAAALLLADLLAAPPPAPAQSEPRRILVTAAQPLAEPLTAPELDLRVRKKPAEVTRVYQPEERPVRLALLLDDSAGAEVAQSLPELAAFLRSLPAGSEVMVAYLRGGSLEVTQAFTTDLAAAAAKLRAPTGSPFTAPGSLGQTVLEALAYFPAKATLRRQILYVGEGLVERDSYHDVPLNRAIAAAQARGIPVWVMRVRSASRPEDSAGSGRTRAQAEQEQLAAGAPPSQPGLVAGRETAPPPPLPMASVETPEPTALPLKRLSQETGGEAFALGVRPPTLAPYLDELRALLDRQYLVEFTPPVDKKGAPVAGKLTLQVRGRREVGLLYPQR